MTQLVKIGLPGSFVDAFVYRTQLYVVTLSGELRIYKVSAIENTMGQHLGDVGEALAYYMFHTSGLGASQRQREARRSLTAPQLSDATRATAWLDIDGLEYITYELGVAGYSVLDILMYNDRLYLSTDSGLLSGVPNPRQMQLEHRLPHRCLSTKVSLGAVAASCGSEGLNLLYDDFGWLGAQSKAVTHPFSIRCSYAGLGLVNYTSNVDFDISQAAVSERDARTRAIVGFGSPQFGTIELLETLLEEYGHTSPSAIDYTFNYRSTFVAFIAGKVYSADTRYRGEVQKRTVGRPHVLAEYAGQVVNAQLFGNGVLVETQEAALFLTDGNSEIAYDGPVVSLRVFPRSVRYQELGVLACKEGLILVSLVQAPVERSV